tara:strand:- start:13 stop:210 length:198 start_codon:yes stop_codon:yes gene_type:complete
MLKYIQKLIQIKKEIHLATTVLRKETNVCKDSCLSSLECRELGIERSGYVSFLLGTYKDLLDKKK